MKSWIHEIAESYVSGHKPVRRDIKENYVQLNEEQRFGLLSENVLNYLDEQLQNAFGFGVSDLNEEELGIIIQSLLEATVWGKVKREKGKKLGVPMGDRGVRGTKRTASNLGRYRDVPFDTEVEDDAKGDPKNAAFLALGGSIRADEGSITDPKKNPWDTLEKASDPQTIKKISRPIEDALASSQSPDRGHGETVAQLQASEVAALRALGPEGRRELPAHLRQIYAPRAR